MQERLLFPRVWHFGKNRVGFECDTSAQHDIFDFEMSHRMNNPYTPAKDLLRMRGQQEFLWQWFTLVDFYSTCDLTNSRDRLSAIAGIAKRIVESTGYTYLAGIWAEDAALGLTWCTHSVAIGASRPSRLPGPTWSWVFAGAGVYYHEGGSVNTHQPYMEPSNRQTLRNPGMRKVWTPCALVTCKTLEPWGCNVFTAIESGRLAIFGRVQRIEIRVVDTGNDGVVDNYMAYLTTIGTLAGILVPDTPPEDLTNREDLYCVLLGFGSRFEIIGGRDEESRTCCAILLELVSDGTSTYKRVGLIETYEWSFRSFNGVWNDAADGLLAGELREIELI